MFPYMVLLSSVVPYFVVLLCSIPRAKISP